MAIRAHALKFKGTCLDEASTLVSQAIQAFGHKWKLAIKTDNEPALLDLRNEVIKKLDEGILPIRPPPYDSHSNGAIESGVKTFQGLLRMHLLTLEQKAEMHVPTAHPLMRLLIEHVTDITTKYLGGSDGKTAYNRLYGKLVHEEQLEFGENILYRVRPSKDQTVLLDPRWRPGIWLGCTWGVSTLQNHGRSTSLNAGQ